MSFSICSRSACRVSQTGIDDKLVTVLHELYHISPAFDGDLRRHDGRYQLHTHSQREYDCQMGGMARAYLASNPDPTLHAFLRLNFAQLQRPRSAVLGIVVPRPKIIPLLGTAANITSQTLRPPTPDLRPPTSDL